MYGLFYRRLVIGHVFSNINRLVVQDLRTSHLGIIQNARLFPISIKLFSTGDEQVERKHPIECSFTASYLINSCGLSPEIAKSVAKRVKLQSFKQPDSVLNFFKNYGFTNAQIAKLVRFHPRLLLANPKRSVLPKLEFLKSVGVTDSELAESCSSWPFILTRSLENLLIPNYKFLKSVHLSDENIIKVFRNNPRAFTYGLQKNMSPKIAVLRELGMPEPLIALVLTCYVSVVLQRCDKFDENVKKVIELGFDTQKCEFIHAMHVFASNHQSVLEHKMDAFRKCGWSDEDIRLAFRKCPNYLNTSVNKIVGVLDFLVNKMGWQHSAVAHVPYVFKYSLEKRITPRCSVVRVLLLKGLINEENQICLSSVVISSNKYFLDTFVIKYQYQVPELLNIFHGKLSIRELGYGFEQMSGLKKYSL